MGRPFKHQWNKPAYIQKREDAKRKEWEGQQHKQYIDTIHAITNQLKTQLQETSANDAKRAFREKLTIALLFGTIFAAGLGDWFFYGQREEMVRAYGPIKQSADAATDTAAGIKGQLAVMQGQLDAIEADQRPWVRPKVIKVDPFVITKQKLSFGITLEFFNSGKSPAFNVDYTQDFVSTDYPRLLIRHDDKCKAAEMASSQKDERLQRHFTIFPNESGNMMFSFPIDTTEVDRYNVKPNGPATIFWVSPIMIGCIAYRSENSPKYHHTGFSYEFGKAAPDGIFTVITSGPQVIDATNVRIRPGITARDIVD
jgi:hypothetical protein